MIMGNGKGNNERRRGWIEEGVKRKEGKDEENVEGG
jgi:hypothetical protein